MCVFFEARKLLVKGLVKKSYISKFAKRILAMPIFLLYEVKPEFRYVLSNLAVVKAKSI